jgi:hypothetical protein
LIDTVSVSFILQVQQIIGMFPSDQIQPSRYAYLDEVQSCEL